MVIYPEQNAGTLSIIHQHNDKEITLMRLNAVVYGLAVIKKTSHVNWPE